MPGMNGIQLCKEIRKINPMSIIHAVTGYASLFELTDCREAGFDDYYTKPVKLELLYRAAEEAFNKIERWKNR
jgi:CheY-like chemotaxis protein